VGDISETEANIHAGVKYMRWMIDQYYEKEPMTKLDKALFAFASYNAGAGRIAQLRKEAAKRGLDPNVCSTTWSMSRRKGRAETVTYRRQHLQVLHCLQTAHGSQDGERAGHREDEGPEQISFSNSQQSLIGQRERTIYAPPTNSSVDARIQVIILAARFSLRATFAGALGKQRTRGSPFQ